MLFDDSSWISEQLLQQEPFPAGDDLHGTALLEGLKSIPDQQLQQGPLPGDEDFYGDDPWEPDGITIGLGDGEFGFYFLGTTWGYYVFGEGVSVDGGTELSDGSWLVPGGIEASMVGRDDDGNGLPDGVTFEPAGGV